MYILLTTGARIWPSFIPLKEKQSTKLIAQVNMPSGAMRLHLPSLQYNSLLLFKLYIRILCNYISVAIRNND